MNCYRNVVSFAYRQYGITSKQQLCTHWPIGRGRRLSEILYLLEFKPKAFVYANRVVQRRCLSSKKGTWRPRKHVNVCLHMCVCARMCVCRAYQKSAKTKVLLTSRVEEGNFLFCFLSAAHSLSFSPTRPICVYCLLLNCLSNESEAN